MPSNISEILFREPSGRRDTATLVQFAGAVVFVSMYVYFSVLGADSLGWLLVMAAGFTLAGLAESVPTERKRAAGLLRLTSMLVFLALIVAILLSSEVILG